jgi:hypothetical protein
MIRPSNLQYKYKKLIYPFSCLDSFLMWSVNSNKEKFKKRLQYWQYWRAYNCLLLIVNAGYHRLILSMPSSVFWDNIYWIIEPEFFIYIFSLLEQPPHPTPPPPHLCPYFVMLWLREKWTKMTPTINNQHSTIDTRQQQKATSTDRYTWQTNENTTNETNLRKFFKGTVAWDGFLA